VIWGRTSRSSMIHSRGPNRLRPDEIRRVRAIQQARFEPVLKNFYAGYPFSVEYNEERGHHTLPIDQKRTETREGREATRRLPQLPYGPGPGHDPDARWEAFNRAPFDSLSAMARSGITCSDCLDAETMDLVDHAPRVQERHGRARASTSTGRRDQEMRSYVCGQCHVEYYFKGEERSHVSLVAGQGRRQHRGALCGVRLQDWTHKDRAHP